MADGDKITMDNDSSSISDLINVQIETSNIQSSDLKFRQQCYRDQERNFRGDVWVKLATAVIATGQVHIDDIHSRVDQLMGQYDKFMRN